ncbi:aldehyde ferredoxin oxidoreductase C-terminal domain-containing protein, partial [Cetobacterium sp.]
TGENYTEESLDLAAERVFTLHRALTVKNMNTINMREEHDGMTDWVFDKDPDIKAFTPGTDKMDREDMQVALTMFYKEMGWDEKTGAPTKETLNRLGMADVAVELERLNLLPA